MLYDRLETIRQNLEDENPAFGGNVFIVQKYLDSGFHGFDDNYLPAYLYLDIDRPIKRDELQQNDEFEINNDDIGVQKVIGHFKAIAVLRCANAPVVVNKLVSQLKTCGTEVISASINPYYIYEDETGEGLTDDVQIIRVKFDLYGVPDRCSTIGICEEAGCCS